MSNIEGMYSICLIKKIKRSETILLNSIFVIRYSAVCWYNHVKFHKRKKQ